MKENFIHLTKDNFDEKYSSGWRRLLFVLGITQISLIRKIMGGRWESWWVEPCFSHIWHPVVEKSCPIKNIRPCPVWNPIFIYEEY